MDLGLHDGTYVVTGASRGLGLATAQVLAAEGASTVLVARDEERLDRAIRGLGAGHRAIVADLSDPSTAETIAVDVGMVDGVLVNVGGPSPGSLLALDDRAWRDAIDGVLLASIRLLRALAPVVREGGSILVVLSTSVKEPIAGLGASNVLRPGLAMAVKELADALAPHVRVNGILPGRIETDRLREVMAGDLGEGIPLGRPGDPAEFGRVAAFLLSPAASYVTGTLVPVDGGLLRSPW